MIALWLVSTGFAQTPEPAPTPAPADGEARAKVLFENGSQLYEEGQYEAAILAFRSALEAWPGATSLHYNLSNCHERLGQLQPAYDELNLYRATAPPEERDTIERRLRALEARMATPQPAPAPAPAPAPTPTPTPAPAQGVASSADRHPRWLLVGLGVGAMGLGGAGAGAPPSPAPAPPSTRWIGMPTAPRARSTACRSASAGWGSASPCWASAGRRPSVNTRPSASAPTA